MIPLGLRLTLSGGREALTRLAILAAAVGIGVGLLLTALAAINAVNAQNHRHAWLWTGTAQEPAGHAPAGTDPLWWSISGDNFGGRTVVRVDVAATGPTSPVPPGIPRDPAPGQYYASPALASLLRSTPADELADRYPGRLACTIGHAALPSPDDLYIIIGHTPAQLAHRPDTVAVTTIATAFPSGNPENPKGLPTSPPDEGVGASGVDLIFSVVALALLTPVLIFIATATRLSAARREQRFAAMRLAGARPRQISVIAAVESTVAATAGVAAGFGLFFVLRIPLAAIPFTGEPFFPADLSLSLRDILVVAIGVPVAAAVVARLALRRVQISPLGVTRRVTPKPPRAWRILPLLAGLAELGFFVVHGRPVTAAAQTKAYVPGFLLIMFGLVIAGPWLTMIGARIMARRTNRPSTLIAARRLGDDPRGAFRAVSGLVLALFITTVAVAAITTQDAKEDHPVGWVSASNVLVDDLAGQPLWAQPGIGRRPQLTAPGSTRTVAPLLARLSRIRGVESVITVRAGGQPTLPRALLGGSVAGFPSAWQETGPVPAALVSCAQLDRVPGLGRCPAGAAAVSFPKFLDASPPAKSLGKITWPAADVPRSPAHPPGPGQHRRRDKRISGSGRAGQDRTGERESLPRLQHAADAGPGDHRADHGHQRLPATRGRGDPGQPDDRRPAPWPPRSRPGWPTASARSACCGSPGPGWPCCAASWRWRAPSRCWPSRQSRSASGSAPRRCSPSCSCSTRWWRRTPPTIC